MPDRFYTPPATRRSAFTLIELLVVMGILVILVVVALPVFGYITGARSTESGVNLTAAMIGWARTLALSRPDNKLIGVMFYTDPESDRDALQIVEVADQLPTAGPERYLNWQDSPVRYRTESTDPIDPHPADVVYAQVIDPLTGTGASFTNRPVVRRYVAIKDNSGSAQRPAGGPSFENDWWSSNTVGDTSPVALDAEVQFLPRGVRARVLTREVVQINGAPSGKASRPGGMILFDKRGHVATRPWIVAEDNDSSVDGGEKLLEAMGLDTKSIRGVGGIAVAIFNDSDMTGGGRDPKDANAVDVWTELDAVQYGVGPESGELISGASVAPAE